MSGAVSRPEEFWRAGALRGLLGGADPDTFFREHWERRALVTRGPASRFAALFDRSAFERSWYHCAAITGRSTNRLGMPGQRALTPADVPHALADGSTVCVSDVQGDPALRRFLDTLSREVLQAAEPSFNVYCSPGGHGFGLHLDDHAVWILQVEGSKEWWYSETPGIEQPLTTVTFAVGVPSVTLPWAGTIARPDESRFSRTVLEPGDALYLPQGAWHRAAAIGRSLALTLSFGRSTVLDLVQRALGGVMARHPELRWNLPGFEASRLQSEPDIPEGLAQPFAAALSVLRDALHHLTPGDLYRLWRDEAIGGDRRPSEARAEVHP